MLATKRAALVLITCLAVGCGDDETASEPDAGTDAGTDAAIDDDAGRDSGVDGGEIDELLVMTEEGPLRGVARGEDTKAFLGIPYAAPPVGDLRWRAPQPVTPWDETFDASTIGPPCPQLDFFSVSYLEGTSEDCLTLNVWAPRGADAAPVMVFVHGGGFTMGSGGLSLFDGQRLSEAGVVVVVTLNYRLGPLGFLAQEDVDDDTDGAAGAYGIADQQSALGWVARNIAAFGGDPENVTIFGESAGGVSVWLHLAAPGSRGLFHRALLESGVYANAVRTIEGARLRGDALAQEVDCSAEADVAACMRGKPPQELLEARLELKLQGITESAVWTPAVGGAVLPEQPSEVIADGRAAPVPILIGTNRNEGSVFARLGYPDITPEEYEALGEELFGAETAARILEVYPPDGDETEAVLAEAYGDFWFVCPARRLVRALESTSPARFLYSFERPVEIDGFPGVGAFHTAELLFVFGNDEPLFDISLTPDDLPLSEAMQGYWTRFAASGDPNGAGAVAWPLHEQATDEHLVLDLDIVAGSGHKSERCDFWDTIPF